jgi:pyrroline-5-carboxylate reductase
MKKNSVGFVGGGRAARIILNGWKRAGVMPPRVVVSDPDGAALQALAGIAPEIEISTDNAAAAAQDICILAVHPPLAKEVVPGLAVKLNGDRQILVSLLPKLTAGKLSAMLGGFDRIARIIPNAASFLGAGYNPVAFADGLPETDRQTLRELFGPLGEAPLVDESTLEAYAIVTAMGPTYFWPQLYRLKALAESFGLAPEAAMESIGQMMQGTLAMMARGGLSDEQVQDLVPVKPLADEVAKMCQGMENKLSILMEKLRP